MTTFKRPDGRKFDEIREIEAKVGVVPNADGSAMYRSGKTVAIQLFMDPKKCTHSTNRIQEKEL